MNEWNAQHLDAWLRQRLGLAADASDEGVLNALRGRRTRDTEAMTEAYVTASWLRRHGREKEAQRAYRKVCRLAGLRYHERMQSVLEPMECLEHGLVRSLTLWMALIVLGATLVGGFVYRYKGMAPKVEHAAPLKAEDSAFVTWLAQLQLRHLSKLTDQEASDEISLPQNTRPLTLQDQLLSMLGRSAPGTSGGAPGSGTGGGAGQGQGQEGQQPDANEGGEGTGRVKGRFQCSVEALYCDPLDIPQAPGMYRAELRDAQLIAAETYLHQRDCQGLARMIDEYKAAGWRTSELELKSSLEMTAQDCFIATGNLDQARYHARRALCAGDQRLASSYLALHNLAVKEKDIEQAKTNLTCAKEACYYLLQAYGPNTQLVENFRAVGAYYWMTLGDAESSVTLTEKAADLVREMIRTGKYDSPYVFQKEIGVSLDLLEVYLTHGGLEHRFEKTYKRLIDNPRLDGDRRVIALSLNVCRLLLERKYRQAEAVLAELIRRYEHLPEMSVGWSWSGFERWVDDHPQRMDEDTALWMTRLFAALSDDVQAVKLAELRKMAVWLRGKR